MPQDRPALAGDTSASLGEPHAAVTWSAILAGAAASLAVALLLSTLVAGFGFRLMSPWPGRSVPATDFSPALGAAMIAVQVASSALGGYLAGRLRTRWINLHSHEAHFRDTAHGLLSWAVSVIAGAAFAAGLASPPPEPPPGSIDAATLAALAPNAAHIASQMAFFLGFGLLLSAFTAAVAAALGGMRREDMYTRYWAEEHAVSRPLGR